MSSNSTVSVTAGGIDVTSLVSSLMAVERQPLTAMQKRQATATAQASAMDSLRTDLSALKTQAAALVGSGLVQFDTTVSNPSAVSATVGSGAATGSVSFNVDRLSSANVLRTSIAATSPTDTITDTPLLALSSSAAPLGISSISALVGTATGSTNLTVTQSSSAASKLSGTVPPSTIIDDTNDTFSVEVNGVAHTVALAHGTHTAAGLATAMKAAMKAANLSVDARLESSGGIRLSTLNEGSAASLKITGGTVLGALGLTPDTSAALGTDAVVSINGVNTTLSDLSAGGTATVGNGSGSFVLGLSGGLRAGSSKVATISPGGGTLRGVADAVNSAGVGVSATVVRAQTGVYHLQMVSGTPGAAGAIVTDPNGVRGGLVETTPAADAQITVGSGAGAYTVTASGNTFDSLVNGTTITVKDVTTSPVTVSLARNDTSTADSLQKLVDSVNALISKANSFTKYDPATRTSGTLAGDATVRGLAGRLRSMLTSVVDSSTSPVAVGLTTQKDGTVSFDRATFMTALQKDPTVVDRLFGRSGSTSGGVSFADAADTTAPGTYAVHVTSPATKAASSPIDLSTLAVGQRIQIRRGSVTTGYTVQDGATPTDIAAGVQAAIRGAGLAVSVGTTGSSATLSADAWGAAGSFEVNLDVNGSGSWSSATGKDVVGIINGSLATGAGQRLSLPVAARNDAKGLAVTVDATVGPNTQLKIDYNPGITARAGYLSGKLSEDTGPLSSGTYNGKVTTLTKQMDDFEARMTVKETAMRSQWSKIQSTLQSLQSQGSWLSNQFGTTSG
jgi:flagellar hook-associated protein 2